MGHRDMDSGSPAVRARGSTAGGRAPDPALAPRHGQAPPGPRPHEARAGGIARAEPVGSLPRRWPQVLPGPGPGTPQAPGRADPLGGLSSPQTPAPCQSSRPGVDPAGPRLSAPRGPGPWDLPSVPRPGSQGLATTPRVRPQALRAEPDTCWGHALGSASPAALGVLDAGSLAERATRPGPSRAHAPWPGPVGDAGPGAGAGGRVPGRPSGTS